ncbi:hypothetical protein T484DRAFT_1867646 [Baffinella frigidus]|nr:hypothetical protein T484DRAFT_1867646 [Cryptophyta sp. CCMP2293]
MARNRQLALEARGSLRLAFVALLLSSAQAFSGAPSFFSNSMTQNGPAFSSRGCAVLLGLKLDLFDKDCVIYALPPALRDATGKGFGLGGIMEIGGSGAWVQPLCFREEDSRELYADTREDAVEVAEDGLVRVTPHQLSASPPETKEMCRTAACRVI